MPVLRLPGCMHVSLYLRVWKHALKFPLIMELNAALSQPQKSQRGKHQIFIQHYPWSYSLQVKKTLCGLSLHYKRSGFKFYHAQPGFLGENSTGHASNPLGQLYSKEKTLQQIVFSALAPGFVAVFDIVIEGEDGGKVHEGKRESINSRSRTLNGCCCTEGCFME